MTHTDQLASLMQQLVATRLSAQALAAQVDVLHGTLAQLLAEHAEPASQATPETEGCRHPMNLRDPSPRTMGHPNRFLCRLCGQVIEES